MSNKNNRIDQIKLEMQVAVDEFNKIQDKIKELTVAREALKMKIFSCQERIAELENLEKEEIKEKVN
tara:strand:- start:213 stop:413 length:201 start_codon:yes stop_codon:yes gene_type:complete